MSNKIALITDTHYGVRGDNIAFLDMTKRFLDDVFFPTLKERGIEHIIHLGDLLDKRKTTNTLSARRLQEDFLDKLVEHNIHLTIIAGNHDTYHKTTNQINALDVILPPYSVYADWYINPIEVLWGNQAVLFLPWMCEDNQQTSLAAIKESNAKYVFGHLELGGFQMYKGVVNEHGMDKALFERFEAVFTGHYHHKSSSGNIYYLGSHGQFTWSDYNDPRGFHILDMDSDQLEFVRNPYDMFIKIIYDDTTEAVIWDAANPPSEDDQNQAINIHQKYVKVIVRNKTKTATFDKMMTALQQYQPIDIQIIDEAFNVDATEQIIVDISTEDTLTIFDKHIDALESPDVPKDDIVRCIHGLYKQAKEM